MYKSRQRSFQNHHEDLTRYDNNISQSDKKFHNFKFIKLH